EDPNKRRSSRSKVFKDSDRSSNCKFLIVLGTFFMLLHSPAVYNTEHIPNCGSSTTFVDRWTSKTSAVDKRYISNLDVNWDHIAEVIEKLTNINEYQGIGLLNFNGSETDQWNQLIPDAEHVVLQLDHVSNNITWESLFPEWIDEEEEFEVPSCPTLPKLQVTVKPRIDLIAVKLPCNKLGEVVKRLWLVCTCNLQLQSLLPLLKGIIRCICQLGRVSWQFLSWLKRTGTREMRRREAYATILHSAHVYVCGAIAAAQSIRMAGSTRDLVILVDKTISEYHRGGLEAAGWKIRTIERIRNPKAERDAYNEWNYSKFRLWQLTDYDKIIFIDADLLILRNIDFLFEMPEITATGNNGSLFNSGVMVVEPSNCTFQLLMDHSFTCLHYLGLKPWLCFRDYDCNWNVDILHKFASNVAHKTWWKVHDAMPENLHKYCLLRSKQKAALEWDRRQAEKGNYTDGHWKIKIQDPRLQTCFEDFCFWESMLWHWGETNWTDNATASPSPPVIKSASLSSL
ncbi:hypothetical protein HYC85_020081, partial [Camellia sinensis]